MAFSQILDAGFIELTKKAAIGQILSDRNQYETVWKTIVKYCTDNKLILSDLYVLSDKENTLQHIYDKSYKIYASNPFRHANLLTNLIHKNTIHQSGSEFTQLKTIIEQEEFAIEYDTRIVATIYQIKKHKSVKLETIINPVSIKNTLYMPAEIELIDIYDKLYDPNEYGSYKTSEEFESILYKQVIERREQGIIGGLDSCKERKKEFIEAIKITLVKDWLPNKKDTVLIGPWAYNWIKLGTDICADVEKIQIISQLTPDELLKELQKYVNTLSKFSITMREQELHIPKDFRTTRYTYYMQIQSERGMTEKPFLDLFNCAQFSCIPYTTVDGILIGHKWVILRFLFIDLWIVRLIKKLNLISADILDKKLINLWRLIEEFRLGFGEKSVITKVEYIGTFREYSIDRKLSKLQGKPFFPYIPEIYLAEKNAYREI
jgi:hypothetical protein